MSLLIVATLHDFSLRQKPVCCFQQTLTHTRTHIYTSLMMCTMCLKTHASQQHLHMRMIQTATTNLRELEQVHLTSSGRGWARCLGEWESGTINGALLTPGYLLLVKTQLVLADGSNGPLAIDSWVAWPCLAIFRFRLVKAANCASYLKLVVHLTFNTDNNMYQFNTSRSPDVFSKILPQLLLWRAAGRWSVHSHDYRRQ